jgi:hypothetical protein
VAGYDLALRSRPTSALLLVAFGASCTVVIDRDRFDDGSAASGGGGGAPSPSSTSSSSSGAPASTSSTGITGTCVPELLHAGFDDGMIPTGLYEDGSDAGTIVPAPTRWGAGAYRIALSETQQYTLLRWNDMASEETYWFGWSTLHEGPQITYGTELFSLECVVAPSPRYEERVLFSLNMNPATPNLPYVAYGEIDGLLDDGQGGAPGFDNLDAIEDDGAFSDWAVRVNLAAGENGFLEVYRNGTLFYSASGQTLPDECVRNDNFHVEFALYRWQDMPPPQSLVLDEITILKAPDAPLTDADVLYTLVPESDCFAD